MHQRLQYQFLQFLYGQNFTVTVNIPSEAVAYEGKISVKFSDGSVQDSGKLVKVTGVDGPYSHPGNMTATFKASVSGDATITVTDLVISNQNGQVNQNSTLTKTFAIASNNPAPTTPTNPTPSNPTTPSGPTYTETGDTVYATDVVNVRSGPGTSNSKIGQLKTGQSVKRIAVGSDGWDKIEYNGTTGYVATQYLTTKNPNENPVTNTGVTYQETGDTVFALEKLNVRSGPGTSNSQVGQLTAGQSVKRIAVGSDGWDKIEYNGTTAYVMSKYLTTKNPNENNENLEDATYEETGDTVYSTTSLNVRSAPGTASSAIGRLKKGDEVTRIAVGSKGWDKIKYNGKTAYVMSKYLTTEKVEKDEDEEENTTNNTVSNNVVDNSVQNNTITDGEAYNKILDEVGVIPAVGKSFSSYAYKVAIILSIGLVAFIGLKIREKDN